MNSPSRPDPFPGALPENAIAGNALFLESRVGRLLAQAPIGFVDVGSRDGVHDSMAPLAAVTAALAFEPDQDECDRLVQRGNPGPWAALALEPVALARTSGGARLHCLSAASNSSLLPVNPAFPGRYVMPKWQEIASRQVRARSLDEVLFSDRAQEPHWGEILKLDTQGTEHDILLGAPRTLTLRTVAVLAEVSFCEIYQGQKLFSDIESLLRQAGFSFYGLTQIHTRSRRLLDKRLEAGRERIFQADAVFFKDPLPGAPHPVILDERARAVLFCAALAFGYLDFALELALATWSPETEGLRALVRSLAAQAPEKTARAVSSLAQEVSRRPEDANLLVGQFVDDRRYLGDYKDTPRPRRDGDD